MKYMPWSSDRLTEICALWNCELGGQFPMREHLLLQNSFHDDNVLDSASWLAVDEDSDRVVGLVVSKVWQEQRTMVLGAGAGWIQVLLVDSSFRKRGIGSELLRLAEENLIQHGVNKIILGRDPWHYFPGIPLEFEDTKRWFDSKGYTDDNRLEHDLLAVYEEDAEAKLPVHHGVELRLLREDEQDALLAFFHRCFPGRWEYEAMQYFEKGGTGREFVVLEKDGQIIGFCRINDAKSPLIAQNIYWAPLFSSDELGGIGPLGVDQAFRGSGYGLSVVLAGVHFLRQRGLRRIAIDWTTLVSFYEKLNFHVWKVYASYSKKLG
ncbi:Acetyltransferase (GNAT) family protein [Paenibacillus sp. yr247]|uniref:GNAT family N-acetyltransferase n=1 Tax=Paenibacillus sp. yr247 TaxID=1761880 RepID=UPI00088D8B34|nr:GNAT family N-acetyltransferase [Paenibacillus sp. yr247]SDN94226.1 Acetyltransferase (GNAT) family protein [Paenibacillus sp. yr247]